MKNTLFTILIAILASFGTYKMMPQNEGVVVKDKETAYERVMRTGTLRCGYVLWDPLTVRDPNTSEFSGVFYDLVEHAAKLLELKVEWVEEINFATYLQDIKNGRYDAECSGGWPTPKRSKHASYSDNLFYLPFVAFVRAGDTRFDNNLSAINLESVTVVGIDGENSLLVKNSDFPMAKTLSLPQIASPDQMLLNVHTGKADVTFTDIITGLHYMKANPNAIKVVLSDKPLRLIPQNLTLPQHNSALRDMFNITFEDMFNSGAVDKILEKYEEYPNTFIRVAKPYKTN